MFGIKFAKKSVEKKNEKKELQMMKDFIEKNKLYDDYDSFVRCKDKDELIRLVKEIDGSYLGKNLLDSLNVMEIYENTIHSPKACGWISSRVDLNPTFNKEDIIVYNSDYTERQKFGLISRAIQIYTYYYAINNNKNYYYTLEYDSDKDYKYCLTLQNIIKHDKPIDLDLISKDIIDSLSFHVKK